MVCREYALTGPASLALRAGADSDRGGRVRNHHRRAIGWRATLALLIAAVLLGITPVAGRASSNAASLLSWSDPFAPFSTVPPPTTALPPAPSPEAMEAELESLRRQEAEREAYWASAAAVAERVASATAYQGLSASSAVDLAREKFRDAVRRAPWRSLPLEPDESVARYVTDHLAQIRGTGGHGRALLDSLLPLRTTAPDGSKAPVKAGLVDRGSSYAPGNPLVPSDFPKSLVTGISVGRESLRLIPMAAYPFGISPGTFQWGAQAAGSLVGNKVFYANVDTDTDWIAGPTALGAQVLVQLRSPQSPEALGIHLDLPADSELTLASDGSGAAVVKRGDVELYRIQAPAATDAQARPVPVSYDIDGSTLVVDVRHRGEDYGYPILVDPVLDDQRYWFDGTAPSDPGWSFSATDANFVGWFNQNGLNVVSSNTYYPSSQYGWWVYAPPPGTGFVFRAEFGHQSLTPASPSSCLLDGIVDQTGWTQAGGGPYGDCTSFSGLYRVTCASANCASQANAGAYAAAAHWIPSEGTRTTYGLLTIGGAAVFLGDPEDPGLSSTLPTGWVSQPPTSATVTATDPGLGVVEVDFDNGDPAWEGNRTVVLDCYGTSYLPCPANQAVTSTFAALPEGVTSVEAYAMDAGGREASLVQDVKVDTSAPELEVSGPLHDLADQRLPEDSYSARIDAFDGDAGDPATAQSGVRSIEVLVDGQRADYVEQPCSGSLASCPLSRTFTFRSADYALGTHTIRVVATDGVGHTSTEQWDVVTTAGILNEPSAGLHTARRLMLQADGKRTGQTGVTFEYRRSDADPWTTVPTSAVTDAHLSPVGAWPLTLASGKSPTLVWDLSQTADIGDTGGPVEVRAVFTGGPGGTSRTSRRSSIPPASRPAARRQTWAPARWTC